MQYSTILALFVQIACAWGPIYKVWEYRNEVMNLSVPFLNVSTQASSLMLGGSNDVLIFHGEMRTAPPSPWRGL